MTLQLQWQHRIMGWKLIRLDTGQQVAWASRGDYGGSKGQIMDEAEMRTNTFGVHGMRQKINREVDKRSIGLFGLDDLEVIADKN